MRNGAVLLAAVSACRDRAQDPVLTGKTWNNSLPCPAPEVTLSGGAAQQTHLRTDLYDINL